MIKWVQRLAVTGAAILVGAAPVGAGEDYTLASAQVVTSTTREPLLRLHASGPVAFRVLSDAELGVPAAPGKIVARLYGVYPGAAMASGSLAPFNVVATAMPDGTLLTVTTVVPSGARLELRTGNAASELEVRQVPDGQ